MNGRHRIFAIGIAGLGLAGGLAVGVVPASAAPHAVTSQVCAWTVTVNGTNFFRNPGQDVIVVLNKGAGISNTMAQTQTVDGTVYERGFRNGVAGWANLSHLKGGCNS